MALRLWSKLSRVSLDTLDQEQDALRLDRSHMTLRYELLILAHSDGYSWRDIYHFADKPELAILEMLKERAETTFEELYNQEPANISLLLNIIQPDQREHLPTIRK